MENLNFKFQAKLSAKYRPISGEFSKTVINIMETKLNLRKEINGAGNLIEL